MIMIVVDTDYRKDEALKNINVYLFSIIAQKGNDVGYSKVITSRVQGTKT